MTHSFTAILLAAGHSARMGSDKLWLEFWGRPAWRWSLDTLLATPGLARVAIAVPRGAIDRYVAALPPGADERAVVVEGGESRDGSVIAGINALVRAGATDTTLVLVHDAARPALAMELVLRVVEASFAADGAAVVPVVPVIDSLKRVRHDRVAGAVERDEVAAAQTPQAARLSALRAAIEEAHAWGRPITDDAGALAAAGRSVHVVAGDPINWKLTGPDDVDAMRGLLAAFASPLVAPGNAAPIERGARAGIGFDAHRLVPGRPMRIGGLSWPKEPRGPEGHSDGDAALHALTDALLGAASLGDIGTLFPPGEPAWEGADSSDLLTRAVKRLRDAGWVPAAVDLAIAIAQPQIAERRDELTARLGKQLGIDPSHISIKGTTSDGLGFGGIEGVAAWAVATVRPAG